MGVSTTTAAASDGLMSLVVMAVTIWQVSRLYQERLLIYPRVSRKGETPAPRLALSDSGKFPRWGAFAQRVRVLGLTADPTSIRSSRPSSKTTWKCRKRVTDGRGEAAATAKSGCLADLSRLILCCSKYSPETRRKCHWEHLAIIIKMPSSYRISRAMALRTKRGSDPCRIRVIQPGGGISL